MKDIVIIGSGGFAREVAHLIEDINEKKQEWNLLGFLDENREHQGQTINELPVLGGMEWLEQRETISVVLGIGSPEVKKRIVNKIKELKTISYPNLIHPTVNWSRFNNFGKGNIICEGNILTTNIKIEHFVTINLNCTIGHDTKIGSYSTVLPNASISGNVTFGECVEFGTNSTIIQGIIVGERTIVGAGAVVVRNLPARCTAVGMPAKPIKFHEEC
ncbi:acetyltransferase [Paenisporosarcina macmurdoensis]|uniref:Acetyltransferase n=1 Tax=Paenisporosarcina macmurdoensis TaxID=212659 RepID=A0ABW1LAI7_9BACL